MKTFFQTSTQIFQDIENDNHTTNGLFSVEQLVESKGSDSISKIRSAQIRLGVFQNFYQLNLLEAAALVGSFRICQFLMGYIDPSDNNNTAIEMAALSGNQNVVNLFLQHEKCIPSANESEALILAIGENTRHHNQVAELLLQQPSVLSSVQRQRHLHVAAKVGNDFMIARLLQFDTVNPSAFPTLTLGWALTNKHHHTTYTLYHWMLETGQDPFAGIDLEQIGQLMDVIANRAFQVKVAREVGGDFAIQKPAAMNGETASRRALPTELTTHILSFAFGQDNTFAKSSEIDEQVVEGVADIVTKLNKARL